MNLNTFDKVYNNEIKFIGTSSTFTNLKVLIDGVVHDVVGVELENLPNESNLWIKVE